MFLHSDIYPFHSLWPRKILDENFCSNFGKEEASPEYKKIAHTFLENFGINNPEDVPIRRMTPEAAQFYRSPGVTRLTGIWLNEELFFRGPLTPLQIFKLAEQAAYYQASTELSILATVKNINDKFPVALPCIELAGNCFFLNKVYHQAKQTEPHSHTSILIDAALLTAIHWIPSLVHDAINRGVNSYSKKLSKKATIAAAHMLCNHEKRSVVEAVIQELNRDIMQGKITGNRHPSTQEIRDCLQEYLE